MPICVHVCVLVYVHLCVCAHVVLKDGIQGLVCIRPVHWAAPYP